METHAAAAAATPLAALRWIGMEAEASLIGASLVSAELGLQQLSIARDVRPSLGEETGAPLQYVLLLAALFPVRTLHTLRTVIAR